MLQTVLRLWHHVSEIVSDCGLFCLLWSALGIAIVREIEQFSVGRLAVYAITIVVRVVSGRSGVY